MTRFHLGIGGGIRLLVTAACVLLLCPRAFSQGSAGRISGAVTDQSGGVLAGATVTVLDVQRGISRTLTADQSGEYVAPSLLPGAYTVRAEFKGFKTVERQKIVLEVNQDIRVDLSLEPGEQTQTITVTEQLPLIETTNASLGGTLSNETINDLPMMGRSYQNLLTLRPGMSIYPGGGGWTMSTNGSRPEENQFILDGLTNDNPLQGLTIINGPGVAGDAATIMPIDAIQEVKIEENPKAEYGGKPGAVVNVGIKSGTNSIHGTAYAFGRDSALDARNYFNDTSEPKRSVSLEQYGVTVGGPIKKDKLFYFLGYEAESYSVGNLFFASVPETVSQPGVSNNCNNIAAGDCSNSLPDALQDLQAGGATVGNGISPLSLTLTGCPATLPAIGSPSWSTYKCTGGLYPANTGNSPNIPQGFPSTFRSDNGVVKIDYHINDHNTLNGMYFQSGGLITAEDVVYLQPQWRSVQENRPRVAGIDWTWTPNSQWVNSARFGFVRMNRMSQQVDSSVPPSNYGIFTGVTMTGSLPIIRVQGFTPLGGSPGWPYRFGPDTVYQFVDYVSYLHGNHAFKFGGDLRRNLADPSQFGAAKGAINFRGGGGALENMLAGNPTFATIQSGSPARELSQWAYALSIQDDWRLTPKLTLNLGLRYDYTTPMAEAHNLLGGFDPNIGMVQVGQQIKSLYNGDHKNFGPRLGLAWDLSGKGTTVIRAGGGIIFNSMLPMQTFTGLAGNAVNVSGGVATVPTGAALVVNGVSTPGTGTIAVANVTVPGGAGSALASNWQNNSSSVPIFSGANNVECGDGSNDAAGNGTSPCALAVIDHNFRTPYVTTWTLGIQHALTNDLSVDISYVGNHGSRLNGIRDINQPPVGAGFPGADALGGTPLGELAWCNANNILTASAIPVYQGNPITCTGADVDPGLVQAASPFNGKFPYLGPILVLSNLYKSNYNGLQATLQQRTAHGLSFLASYTYSHSLDDDSYNIGQFLPQDSTNPAAEYASSDFDITHRFTFSITYAIPGKKSPGQLLEGWELNSVITVQTGQPWYGNDQSNNTSGTNENTDRWDFFGKTSDFRSGNSSIPFCIGTNTSDGVCTQTNPSNLISGNSFTLPAAQSAALFSSCLASASKVDGGPVGSAYNQLVTLGCYAQGDSVLIPPALGTFGTAGRNIWRDPGLRNWDLSVTKQFKFQERLTAQFRAEFFNVLNHPNFTNPYGASSGFGIGNEGDPSVTNLFGCGCATPDQAAGNPVLGSGGNRAVQLGLKLIF
ncbi:MAG TPA: TonB-dependent receptor [Candidatus Acidoferrales bacterium]|nr:TonB-dependent receptor [Candidatus Acidoferrales bacterium]